MVVAAPAWINFPNRGPVFAKPHDGSSILNLSSALQTFSTFMSFIINAPLDPHHSSKTIEFNWSRDHLTASPRRPQGVWPIQRWYRRKLPAQAPNDVPASQAVSPNCRWWCFPRNQEPLRDR